MSYISFDQSKEFDLLLLGRVTIDFNPAYNDQVKEEFKPLKNVHMFEKFVGGFSCQYFCRCYKAWTESRFYRNCLG
ncbi:hypothetical protein EfmJHP80_28450 [Enterococcus faecium]|nr:hypothetical protein [Enterococcus faecium]BDP65349.1 hypothetical protein EfmJHP80_28450 [Enterococcus faecium]